MKISRSPLATMDKQQQRRKLQCDIRRWQRSGGCIRNLNDGTARGLCSIERDDIEQQIGFYREV